MAKIWIAVRVLMTERLRVEVMAAKVAVAVMEALVTMTLVS